MLVTWIYIAHFHKWQSSLSKHQAIPVAGPFDFSCVILQCVTDFFFSDTISFPLHGRQIHALRPVSWWQPGEGKQPDSAALLLVQLSSRAHSCANTALPHLLWARAAPSGQLGTPGTRKQRHKVLYSLTVRQRLREFSILLSVTLSWTLKELSPSRKTLNLGFLSCLCTSFP